MTDPYAPPHVRRQMATTTGPDEQSQQASIDYVREAVAYVQRSVEAIGKQRTWIEQSCENLANRLDVLPPDRPATDPVVAGLLDHLPRAGAVWPQTERKQWLALLEGSFNLIYKDAADRPLAAPDGRMAAAGTDPGAA